MNVDKAGFVCWSKTQFVKPYSSTEYIRKGAISDLLNSEMKRHADRHSVDGISACHAMRELIEKFNNL